jgi:hypothetical protein
MDKETFNKEVLRPLEMSSNAGDATNELGTRLIGHAPHIAPKAYIHVVYAPLSEVYLHELKGRLGRPVPPEYEAFLANANGMSLFVGEMRVLGYVPLERRASVSVYHYPSNLMIPNVSARLVGLSHGAVVVGWYKADGSYAVVEEGGTVTRFDPKGGGSVMRKWSGFDSWLSSEVGALRSVH